MSRTIRFKRAELVDCSAVACFSFLVLVAAFHRHSRDCAVCVLLELARLQLLADIETLLHCQIPPDSYSFSFSGGHGKILKFSFFVCHCFIEFTRRCCLFGTVVE